MYATCVRLRAACVYVTSGRDVCVGTAARVCTRVSLACVYGGILEVWHRVLGRIEAPAIPEPIGALDLAVECELVERVARHAEHLGHRECVDKCGK